MNYTSLPSLYQNLGWYPHFYSLTQKIQVNKPSTIISRSYPTIWCHILCLQYISTISPLYRWKIIPFLTLKNDFNPWNFPWRTSPRRSLPLSLGYRISTAHEALTKAAAPGLNGMLWEISHNNYVITLKMLWKVLKSHAVTSVTWVADFSCPFLFGRFGRWLDASILDFLVL